jgi:predicted metal-binding protein
MVNIDPFIQIHSLKITSNDIFLKENIGIWCQLPYPDHPNGCPNYGKSPLCPPRSPFFNKDIYEKKELYLFYMIFEFDRYKQAMRNEKPDWTEKQIACVLYWQSSVKLRLKQAIYDKTIVKNRFCIFGCGSGFDGHYSMEAVGINVVMTLKHLKIDFEVKPKNKIVLCALCVLNEPLREIQKKEPKNNSLQKWLKQEK